MKILFEDNHLLVVDKPAGVPVQGDASDRRSLLEMAREYLRVKYQKPGNVFVGLVHRLDLPVRGVVVFAKTSKAASRLSQQIRSRTVGKTYVAVVEGTVTSVEWVTLVHHFANEDGVSRVLEKPEAGSKEARLSFRVLETGRSKSLVEIALETGRKHQIRLQMAASGHPIVGDARYGAKGKSKTTGIQLACVAMKIQHPTTKATMRFALDVEALGFDLPQGPCP